MEKKVVRRTKTSLVYLLFLIFPTWAVPQDGHKDHSICYVDALGNRVCKDRPVPKARPSAKPKLTPQTDPNPVSAIPPGRSRTNKPHVPDLEDNSEHTGQAPILDLQDNRALLYPVRGLIEPGEYPPEELGGYGMVAFTANATPDQVERHRLVCEAYKATLVSQDKLPKSIPLQAQMVTYWPITSRSTELARRFDCNYLVEGYDLGTGLDAIRDADKQQEGLATRRGPFLVAWAPARSRSKKDVVVLVIDLSNFDGQASFIEVFKRWRQRIVDDPKLWERGWDWQSVRLALRGIIDRYGVGVVRLIQSDKG